MSTTLHNNINKNIYWVGTLISVLSTTPYKFLIILVLAYRYDRCSILHVVFFLLFSFYFSGAAQSQAKCLSTAQRWRGLAELFTPLQYAFFLDSYDFSGSLILHLVQPKIRRRVSARVIAVEYGSSIRTTRSCCPPWSPRGNTSTDQTTLNLILFLPLRDV